MKKIDFSNPKTWKFIRYAALGTAGIISIISDIAEARGNEIAVMAESKDLVNAMTENAIRDQMEGVAKKVCSEQLAELINEMAKTK